VSRPVEKNAQFDTLGCGGAARRKRERETERGLRKRAERRHNRVKERDKQKGVLERERRER
jgi:hypothetical protein